MKIKKLKIKLNKDNEYSDYRYFMPKSNNIKMTDGRDVDEAVQSLKDKIANLKEQANYLIDKAPLVKYAEGTSITITDCAEAPLRKFSIEGDSYQETREGYNKAKYTSDSTNVNFDIGDIETGKTYSLYIKVNGYVSFNLKYGSTGSTIATEYSVTGERVYKIESTQNAVLHFNGFIAELGAFVSVNNIMLLEGEYTLETLPLYEQYGAAPSIEYEAPIESVGDNINLFDKDKATANHYVLNTTGVLVASQVTSTSDYIEVKANKPYTISYNYNTLQNTGGRAIALYNKEKTFLSGKQFTISDKKVTITPTEDGYIRFSYDNNCFDIKVEQNSKATPYSPYGQGSIEVHNCNKNLFDKNDTNKILSAIPDGNTLKIKSNSNGRIFYIKCKPSTNYTISKLASKRLQFWDSIEKPAIGVTVNSTLNTDYAFSGKEKTVKTSSSAKYLVCYYYNSSTDTLSEETIRNSIQLEEGETATEYVEGKSQTKALYTQQPFRAIGDVKDRFVKQNGVWYEEHSIERLILNGTENWGKSSNTNNNVFYIQAIFNTLINKGISNYFTYRVVWDIDIVGIEIYNNRNLRFGLGLNSEITTLEQWKAKLTELYNAGKPVYVDYVLAEPLLIPCTPEQVEVLESLQSYDKITYYSVDKTNNVQANIKLIYKQDINAILEGEGV